MHTEWLNTNTRGSFLLEALLASAVGALFVIALGSAYLYGQEAAVVAGNRTRALLLGEEGLEAARNIRDDDFSNLVAGTHGLAISSNQWSLFGANDTADIFTRRLIVSDIDATRKLVTAEVTWQQTPQRTGLISLTTRLTNWMRTAIGNWASPFVEISRDISGAQNGIKIQAAGNYAYMVRNDGTPDFLVIDITNPAASFVTGFLALTGVPTNIYILGNYAYVSNTSDAEELQIIDISNPSSPTVVGIYNAPGTANANGVFVAGATAYLVFTSSANPELRTIDVTNPASPQLLGSLELGATGYEIAVSGNYAYIASGHNSQELQVINVTNPASPIFAGSSNLPGSTDAITIAITGTTALIGQGSTLVTRDITTPSSPLPLGSTGTGGTLNDIALNLGNGDMYVFLATSAGGSEFQVITITNPATPSLLSSLDIAGANPLLGIAYDAAKDRVFGAGSSNTQEFIVIAPQ